MADIEINLELKCDDCGNIMHHQVVVGIAVAKIEVRPCAVCRRVAQKERADEVLALEAEMHELRKYKARMDWLHAGGGEDDRDAEGYEWGVARVKFNAHGQPASVLWTSSDHHDLDAEMERTKLQNST